MKGRKGRKKEKEINAVVSTYRVNGRKRVRKLSCLEKSRTTVFINADWTYSKIKNVYRKREGNILIEASPVTQ